MMNAAPEIVPLNLKTARLLAVPVLLADPEALGGGLKKHHCDLREKLRKVT